MSTSPAPEPPADAPVDPALRFAQRTGVRPEAVRRLTEKDREILAEAAQKLTPEAVGVVAAVTDIRKEDLFPRLAALPERDRHSCVPYLKRFLRLLRDNPATTSIHYRRHRQILRLAGIVCEPTPAAAARWISRDELWWSGTERHDADRLLEFLAERPARWRADLVTHIAEHCGEGTETLWYPLVRELVLTSDIPAPDHDTFVQAWVRDLTYPHRYRVKGLRPTDYPDTLLERLRHDPLRDTVLPRVFRGDTVALLVDRWVSREDADQWPLALAVLAEEGRLDRAALLDAVLACLLRGGRPSRLTACFEVLTNLDPTDDECAERVPVLLRLLPETLSTVAGYVQRKLRALDDAGRLATEHLVDASRSVLFRTEKKLLRAQLSWLDRAARRDPARAGAAVSAVTAVFGHEDTTVQEKAWGVAVRHLPNASDEVRADLAAASAALNPGLRDRAAELLGMAPSEDAEPEPVDLLPPVGEPAPLGPPPATAAEVAEEVGVVVQWTWSELAAVRRVDVPTFERALDGLVRHAHRDLGALVAALEPVARACPWEPARWFPPRQRRLEWRPRDLRYVLAHLLGEEHPDRLWWEDDALTPVSRFSRVMRARLHEVAHRLAADPPPFLLATPSTVDGRIDPAELVARIGAYEDADVSPGEADLSQALLRVDATACTSETLDRAGKLESPAGQRLAAWLAAGGLPEPTGRGPWDGPGPGDGGDRSRVLLVTSGTVVPPGALHEEFRGLLEGRDADDDKSALYRVSDPHWLAMLPVSRELLALRLQEAYAAAAVHGGMSGSMAVLPALAEAGGGAGTALHMSVACALGALDADDRPAAVDALLVLAARGDLDAALLGRCLGEAVRSGTVKVQRLAAALRDAAAGGAYGTVWSVLEAALPDLLRHCDGPAPRGLADLVAVAAECAHRCGAGEEIPEVTEVAERKGRTRLVREARLLRDTLAAG